MSALSKSHQFRSLVETDATWRLLRTDNAAITVALLSEHLSGENRRMLAAELYEAIDHDLGMLRANEFELRQTAQAYCAEWRKAGFLIRRPAEDTRGETFELSPGALGALRFVEQLAAPRQTVTESRLSSIAAQLSQLAIDTDPDTTRRLEQLHVQRDRLDTQIERINAGEDELIDSSRAAERVHDILAQAEELPSDFARVRAKFEELNRDLRARIVESDASQRAVLDEVFRGVDLISESEEGLSFSGFSTLVLDPAVGTAFDDDIERVLDRDFAGKLRPADRRFLRRFITTLKDHSSEIHDVITAFARGLRRYVQSQDYQHDRKLRELLREAQASAVEASRHIKPYAPTRLSLGLSAVALSSAGAIRLYDPSELNATAPIVRHEPEVADLEMLRALARATEIDFAELTDSVNDMFEHADSFTVGEVLARHPATQGVASVVGLLTLAAHQGELADGVETVHWRGVDDQARAATIRTNRFTGRLQ